MSCDCVVSVVAPGPRPVHFSELAATRKNESKQQQAPPQVFPTMKLTLVMTRKVGAVAAPERADSIRRGARLRRP